MPGQDRPGIGGRQGKRLIVSIEVSFVQKQTPLASKPARGV